MQFILILFFSFINLHSVLAGLRIIGGREVYEDEFPYVLAMRLQIKDKNERGSTSTHYDFMCSSSLISSTWCLTAAHCITGINKYSNHVSNMIRVFTHMQLETKEVVTSPDLKKISEILQSIIHPSYKQMPDEGLIFYPNDDIGLLRCEPVMLKIYAKLSALDFTTLPGHEAVVVGYGMKEFGVQPNDVTLKVYKGVLQNCRKDLDYGSRGLCVSHACATFASSCQGDSGGPILHVSGLVAVTSFGDDNCNSTRKHKMNGNKYVQTVPVSPYIDWITGLMKNQP